MANFLGGGPRTSVEVHDRMQDQAVERALNAAVNGLQALNAIRGGTNPLPEQSGFYDSSDEFVHYQQVNEVIGAGPLAP